MRKAKFTNGVQGKGFAAALVLSICAVGLSTYAAYRGAVSGIVNDEEVEVYDDNVFVFTEPAETVNAEQTGIPKETDAQPRIESETAEEAEPVSVEEAGLLFKNPKTLPIAGGTVINEYSGGELVKSETLGVWKTHDGIDIKAELGAPVKAMNKGKVIKVWSDSLWGNCIKIDHGNGVTGHYYGLTAAAAVSEGDMVNSGDVIGAVGDTAQIEVAQATHLHFALDRNGTWIDPVEYISPSAK